MPVSNRLPVRLFGLGLLSTFCAVAFYGRTLEVQRVRPFGNFTEPQIIDRADVVRSGLMTASEDIETTVKRLGRKFRDGSLHPFWFVDYSNAAGDSMLRLGLDGDSGNIHFVQICPKMNPASLVQFARPGRLTSVASVVKLSRNWVFALNLAPKLGPWNVTCPPTQSGKVWRVAWQCRDQTLNFSFDQKTGRLILAQMRA